VKSGLTAPGPQLLPIALKNGSVRPF